MADKKTLLLGLLSDALHSRLLAEHDTLRALFCSLDDTLDSNGPLAIDDLVSLAATLRAHIRWEERVLFPHMQSHVSTDELRFIGDGLLGRTDPEDANCDGFDDIPTTSSSPNGRCIKLADNGNANREVTSGCDEDSEQ